MLSLKGEWVSAFEAEWQTAIVGMDGSKLSVDSQSISWLYSSNELGKLSYWLCHDENAVNTAMDIIIIIGASLSNKQA